MDDHLASAHFNDRNMSPSRTDETPPAVSPRGANLRPSHVRLGHWPGGMSRVGGWRAAIASPPLSRVLLCLCLACLPSSGRAVEHNVVMITHPATEAATLPRDTARAIFAMRQRTWPDGQAVSVFVLPDDHPVHAMFAKALLDVYPHQLRLAWDRVVFSGTGQAPNRVSSQPEMRERIAATPGALGYIERGYLDDSVRVLPLDE